MACWDPAILILGKMGIANRVTIRKGPMHEFIFAKNVRILFRNADKPSDIKGAEFDVWYLDEANDISRDFYEETLIRIPRGDNSRFLPRARHILSWNPVSRGAWVYTEFFASTPQPDVQIVHSTYRDNPYVLPDFVARLHRWRENDPRRWEVYGLGMWGSPDELIYPSWRICHDDEVPVGRRYDAIGIDWGYANPTAVVGIFCDGGRIIADELLYRTNATIADLCAWAAATPAMHGVPVFCDPAAPASIADLQRAGIAAEPANNDVAPGISWVQGREIVVSPRSAGLRKELQGYCWQRDQQGNLTQKPVKIEDHACDALRYAAYTWHVKGYDRRTKMYRGYMG